MLSLRNIYKASEEIKEEFRKLHKMSLFLWGLIDLHLLPFQRDSLLSKQWSDPNLTMQGSSDLHNLPLELVPLEILLYQLQILPFRSQRSEKIQ